jgi:deoxycytidylate deaminase
MTNLISRIRDSHPAWNDEQARRRAEDLINLDRHQETQPYGQDVLHTFPKADLFVDLIEEDEIDPQIQRLIKILFGETLVPTDEENGMVIAYLTSLRSTSRRRRVGAALTMRARDEQASVVAVGTNEVAHAGGGHPTNPLASEEAHAGIDYSKSRIKRIGADFLKRLRDEDLLSPEFGERTSTSAGIDDAVGTLFHGTHNSAEFEGPMGKAELAKLMEFHHEVHAELSAILDASRRGMPTQDLTLYTTTYPCHLCAKEIVASGISEVVYVEPYPKSAVEAMYEDSIATDRGPDASKITFRWFVGISPARFTELFHVGRPLLREYPDAERRSLNPRVGRGIFQNLTLIERERESH